MDLYQLLQSHRARILEIARTYGVGHIRVFGSVVRQEADEKSDIDLLIDLAPGRSLYDLSGFLVEVEDILQWPVDAVTEQGLKPRIRERVLKEARPL